jgi:hypothetical protein
MARSITTGRLWENRRCRADCVVQQTVLYLGEINDSQREQWIRAIEVFDEETGALEQLKLFAAERGLAAAAPDSRVILTSLGTYRNSERSASQADQRSHQGF